MYLFFDIDGTLTDETCGVFPEDMKQALRTARANGHKLFVNTGRTARNLEQELIDLGFDGFLCGCGTHLTVNGEVMLCEELTHSESVQVVETLREYGFGAYFEGNRYIFFDTDSGLLNDELLRRRAHFIEMGIERDIRTDDPEMVFTKFHAYRITGDRLPERLTERFDCIPRRKDVYEYTPKGYSKATAIDLVLEKLGGTADDCYVFGDSVNDLPMLTHVKHSVAMANGDNEVLETCEYVTDRASRGGIRKALEHYGLI